MNGEISRLNRFLLHAFQLIRVFLYIVRVKSWRGLLVFLGRGYFVCSFLFFFQVAPSPFGPACGLLLGMLWCLGTILWHIHGFTINSDV